MPRRNVPRQPINHTFLTLIAIFAVLTAAAQTSTLQTRQPKVTPRSSDAHPDLGGIWTNATLTPLERPPQLADRPFFTEKEAYAFERLDRERAQDPPPGAPLILGNLLFSGANVGYNVLFFDRGTELARVNGVKRTSLIIDPPNGRIPPLTIEARERNALLARGRSRFDSIKDRPLVERCIIDATSGPPMLPVLYNNNYQFVQTRNYLLIMVEMVHDVRIIRMNGMHKPATIRQLLGDSIGHWEGETLVVDTNNFTNKTRFRGSSEHLHVVERFQRLNETTILYRATIEDPTTFSRPWTIEYPFIATRGPIYEYACHEGNYAVADILNEARTAETQSDQQ